MTWHLVLQSVTAMHKSRGQCVLYFFSFFLFFSQPSFSMNHIRHVCIKRDRKKKGSSVLQLETVACSCCAVLCCVQRKSSLLSRHNNKPACQSRERSRHLSTAPCVTYSLKMKQAQTICSYKIRNCIWQFLNKCIQVQLKAFLVLPSARRVALVTFYVKQELPPDLEVHQEFFVKHQQRGT